MRHFIVLLPKALKKQELEALCEAYKSHLTQVIEGRLKSEHPEVYAQYQKAEAHVFGAPPFKNGKRRAFSIGSACQLLKRFIEEQAPKLTRPSSGLTLAIQKYQALSRLEATLKTPIKPVAAQLADFRQQFPRQQTLIAQDRDSWAVKFAKGAATLLSVGLAALLGIWSVKGGAAVNHIAAVLNTPAIVPTPGHVD